MIQEVRYREGATVMQAGSQVSACRHRQLFVSQLCVDVRCSTFGLFLKAHLLHCPHLVHVSRAGGRGSLQLVEGAAELLPFPDAAFDAAVVTLVGRLSFMVLCLLPLSHVLIEWERAGSRRGTEGEREEATC